MHQGLPPLLGENPRVLILGSFPSPKSREQGEYYGNPLNQFWRIICEIFGAPYTYPNVPPYAERAALLTGNGLALWDTLVNCEVEGAADSAIREPVYNTAIPSLIARHNIQTVFFNGSSAYRFYRRGVGDIERRILPSTSTAYAGKRYEEKLSIWSEALLGALTP